MAGAFARLRQGFTPEERAAVAVNELTRIDGVDVALMLGFPSGPGITRVAADGAFNGRDPWLFVDGCGAYLRRQLETGRTLEDWSEHREAHEQPSCTWGETGLRAVHLEPIAANGVVVGGIVAGSMTPNGRARLVELTPLIAEFGAMVAALVAPEVAKRREVNDLRATIERVLADRAFHSVFQPAFDINAGTLVGYEALTRFTDGTRPDLRFAQGVAAGLGLELEEATMAAALAAAAALPAGSWLSLNASPELILEHQRLSALLACRGKRRIILEVTEHAVVADYGALREAVADLGEGVEIAVDDAGAGFASLRHVIELRPGYVKLDISLIRGVGDDGARQALVAGMVHFAAETGCLLVAEGIETDTELAALRRLGIGLGQGYLLGRPGPLPAISA
jgi:EAL domain-containing protein (putative c-di-GMP-specific phosphodiesterase class I)